MFLLFLLFLLPPLWFEDEEDEHESLGMFVVWLTGNVVGCGLGLCLACLLDLFVTKAWGFTIFWPAAIVLVLCAELGCSLLAYDTWFSEERPPSDQGQEQNSFPKFAGDGGRGAGQRVDVRTMGGIACGSLTPRNELYNKIKTDA